MKAFILRINPANEFKVKDNLTEDRISIGWPKAKNILDPELDWIKFREIVHQTYYSENNNYRASGNAAGSLWRFIREMNIGDIVLIPNRNSSFYISVVKGDVEYLEDKVHEHTAFSRKVEFLNNKEPVKREFARAALISRLKAYQTCVECTDLIEDISLIIEEVDKGAPVPFEEDLRRNVVNTILKEIKTGKIESFAFERLIKNLFTKLGAKSCEIVSRRHDNGSDLIAEFLIGRTIPVSISIQAKHWQDHSPVGIKEIEQLEKGISVDKTNYGIFITSGIYAEECIEYVERKNKEKQQLYLIDGIELANLIYDNSIF
jgi:predicted Mrr-cat superfamily restriction endonuclease